MSCVTTAELRIQAISEVNIIAIDAVCFQVTPSFYTQEMLQSTEEHLANTNEVNPPHVLELFDKSKTIHHKVNTIQFYDTSAA